MYIHKVVDMVGRTALGRGQMGSLHVLCFVYRGTFGVLPLTSFYLPRSARAYLCSPTCQNSLLLLQRPH